jgi:hypothetical protein
MTESEQMILDALADIKKQLAEIAQSERLREKDRWMGERIFVPYELTALRPEPDWS